MLKVYLVEAEYCDYDEYDSCIILADTIEEAKKIVEDNNLFYSEQGRTTVKEIDLKKEVPQILLASFNAG